MKKQWLGFLMVWAVCTGTSFGEDKLFQSDGEFKAWLASNKVQLDVRAHGYTAQGFLYNAFMRTGPKERVSRSYDFAFSGIEVTMPANGWEKTPAEAVESLFKHMENECFVAFNGGKRPIEPFVFGPKNTALVVNK